MWTTAMLLGALSLGTCLGFLLGALVKNWQWKSQLMRGVPLHGNPGKATYNKIKLKTGMTQPVTQQ